MSLLIDKEVCMGCGVCESLCPDVFQIQEDEKAHVIDEKEIETPECQEAIDSCPSQAITKEYI